MGRAIIDAVIERFGTNPRSVIPSDYCYNRWNRLLAKNYRAFFAYVGAGEYRCLGEHAKYSGLIYWRPRGHTDDIVVGERINGVATLYQEVIDTLDASAANESATEKAEAIDTNAPLVTIGQKTAAKSPRATAVPMSKEQIEQLYEEYMRLYALEVKAFGCEPTELRHLMGRLGELYCARRTGGSLVRQVNQHGFDIIGGDGRRISVKTTAQRKGFVRINERTMDIADDLMIARYVDDVWDIPFHDTMSSAIEQARKFDGWFELDFKQR
jgi:hypothetical protein